MGVDYNSVIMYGKGFGSFNDAMGHLVDTNKITREEYNSDLDTGDPSICDWIVYDAYSGGYGVLGETLTANFLYTYPDEAKLLTKNIDDLLGEGCSMHEFVMVY